MLLRLQHVAEHFHGLLYPQRLLVGFPARFARAPPNPPRCGHHPVLLLYLQVEVPQTFQEMQVQVQGGQRRRQEAEKTE